MPGMSPSLPMFPHPEELVRGQAGEVNLGNFGFRIASKVLRKSSVLSDVMEEEQLGEESSVTCCSGSVCAAVEEGRRASSVEEATYPSEVAALPQSSEKNSMRKSYSCMRLGALDEDLPDMMEVSTPSSSAGIHRHTDRPSTSPRGDFVPVFRSGHCTDTGGRKSNEDAFVAHDRVSSCGDVMVQTPFAFYGVFDGHGGRSAADFMSQKMLSYVVGDPQFPHDISSALHGAFLRADMDFEQAMRAGHEVGSGTTALAVVLTGRSIYVANAGDCRAVLSRKGKVVELSRDHRPTCEFERARVLAAGGSIVEDYVNNELAVTRALGDWHCPGLKRKICGQKGPVIADPEVKCADLTEDDEFLIIGCDGLWDAFKQSSNVIAYARRRLRTHNYDPVECSKDLINAALNMDAEDNLTVVTVCFRETLPPSLQPNEQSNSRFRRSISVDGLRALQDLLK